MAVNWRGPGKNLQISPPCQLGDIGRHVVMIPNGSQLTRLYLPAAGLSMKGKAVRKAVILRPISLQCPRRLR